MVIFYDKETKEVMYTEKGTMVPTLPIGSTEEKIQLLGEQNIGFVGVPYEMDLEAFNYIVCLDEEKNFIGLQPKIHQE